MTFQMWTLISLILAIKKKNSWTTEIIVLILSWNKKLLSIFMWFNIFSLFQMIAWLIPAFQQFQQLLTSGMFPLSKDKPVMCQTGH